MGATRDYSPSLWGDSRRLTGGVSYTPPGAGNREESSHKCTCSKLRNAITVVLVVVCSLGLPSAGANNITISELEFNLLVDETKLLILSQHGEFNTSLQLMANPEHSDIVEVVPSVVDIPGSEEPNASAILTYEICAAGKNPGHSVVSFNATPSGFIDLNNLFLRVTVMHSKDIYIISYIMGWIYFAAWSVSFYPQIYINWNRKSVVGLNFDFLALNLIGFSLYSLFNCGLFFSPAIQAEYKSRNPRGVNPVQLNDVFFSLHAAFATILTITQCLIYERAQQTISLVARCIIGLFGIIVAVTLGLAWGGVFAWLDFLYYCSYIKLAITLIKYVPQAYMNYKRKSTVGWSIGNIFLDFVGGFLSMLQMILNAYNYNDWVSIFGDVTKFGLGLFSLVFDIFFMLQHYVFYRNRSPYASVPDSDSSEVEACNDTDSSDTSSKVQIATEDERMVKSAAGTAVKPAAVIAGKPVAADPT